MNSGSGIMHEEMILDSERLLGVQMWLNLPSNEKMSKPSYNNIKKSEIEEIEIDGGKLRLLAGSYNDHQGYKGDHLPLNYYDIHLEPNVEFKIDTKEDDSIMVFTLLGDINIGDEFIEEKTAVKLTDGDSLTIKNGDKKSQVLYINSKKLNEPISWGGPIVMNTPREMQMAYLELRNGTFIKEKVDY